MFKFLIKILFFVSLIDSKKTSASSLFVENYIDNEIINNGTGKILSHLTKTPSSNSNNDFSNRYQLFMRTECFEVVKKEGFPGCTHHLYSKDTPHFFIPRLNGKQREECEISNFNNPHKLGD